LRELKGKELGKLTVVGWVRPPIAEFLRPNFSNTNRKDGRATEHKALCYFLMAE
jgi:hypothetical protein